MLTYAIGEKVFVLVEIWHSKLRISSSNCYLGQMLLFCHLKILGLCIKVESDCICFALLTEMQLATRRKWTGSRQWQKPHHLHYENSTYTLRLQLFSLSEKSSNSFSGLHFWKSEIFPNDSVPTLNLSDLKPCAKIALHGPTHELMYTPWVLVHEFADSSVPAHSQALYGAPRRGNYDLKGLESWNEQHYSKSSSH